MEVENEDFHANQHQTLVALRKGFKILRVKKRIVLKQEKWNKEKIKQFKANDRITNLLIKNFV